MNLRKEKPLAHGPRLYYPCGISTHSATDNGTRTTDIIIGYLKISSSSSKTDKKSSQGTLKLEVPKMTKMS